MRSQQLTNDLEHRFPEDTFVKFSYVPVLRAMVELERGKPAESADRLHVALAYERAANGLNFGRSYLGGLHWAYVRGQALIAAKKYPEAEIEFRKILENRGLVGFDPIGSLARLQLARTLVLVGRDREGEECLQRSLDALEGRRPGRSGYRGSTGGIRTTAVSGGFFTGVGPDRGGPGAHLPRARSASVSDLKRFRTPDTISAHGPLWAVRKPLDSKGDVEEASIRRRRAIISVRGPLANR